MASIPTSLVLTTNPKSKISSGLSLKPLDKSVQTVAATKLWLRPKHERKVRLAICRRQLTVQAACGDGGRQNSANVFLSGFVLGGLIVGALGCVYAPQISKALAGTDRKDLMRKLPKFIYDEEKALEKTRRVLSEKIAQLNSAIDEVSSQLRTDDNEVAVDSDEVEATI